MNKLFSDWYDSYDNGEPTYQETFEAGQQASVCDLTRFKEFSKLAGRALNDAFNVIDTVDGEDSMECEKLMDLLNTLRELTYQAYSLNGVMSASQLDRTIAK